MRDDEGDVRAVVDGFGEEEVHDGASGVEEEFKDRERVLWEGCTAEAADAGGHLGRGGVQEDFGGPSV